MLILWNDNEDHRQYQLVGLGKVCHPFMKVICIFVIKIFGGFTVLYWVSYSGSLEMNKGPLWRLVLLQKYIFLIDVWLVHKESSHMSSIWHSIFL